jgi:hypothetical protein
MMEQETTRTIAQAPAYPPVTDPDSILAQLEKILASPAFCNSKRYPRFLEFFVLQTLLGHADRLKERLLGIEVFDWVPDYDLATDPIVALPLVRSASDLLSTMSNTATKANFGFICNLVPMCRIFKFHDLLTRH